MRNRDPSMSLPHLKTLPSSSPFSLGKCPGLPGPCSPASSLHGATSSILSHVLLPQPSQCLPHHTGPLPGLGLCSAVSCSPGLQSSLSPHVCLGHPQLGYAGFKTLSFLPPLEFRPSLSCLCSDHTSLCVARCLCPHNQTWAT